MVTNDSSTELKLAVPLHVFLGEGIDCARFATKYWANQVDGQGKLVRPGLESVKLAPDFAGSLRAQVEAAQKADHDYRMTVDKAGNDELRSRAQFVISEVSAVLEYHFDDDTEDENDERLERLSDVHASIGDSFDALAMRVEDYCQLAEPLASTLHGLGGFDSALIEEGADLAKQLRDIPPIPLALTPAAKEARAVRNAHLIALQDSVRELRAAARFVFRNHPDIIREATSAWQRRRRAEKRLATAKANAAAE